MDTAFFRFLLSTPFSPLPFFWLLATASAICFYKKKRGTGRRLMGLSLAWLLLISTGPVPGALVASLEKQYPPLLVPPSFDEAASIYILVLGAGHTNNPALPVTGQLSGPELGRLIEGVRLQKLVPGSVLVTSGKKGKKNTESQAATVRKAGIELGVPAEQTDTLSFTTNTRDEAQHFQKRFGTKARLILVTDAVHMPRAMMWFQKAGLDPAPAPMNFILKDPPGERPLGLVPGSDHIENMEKAVHEYLGLLWLFLNT